MAIGAKERLNADYAVSVTGLAGPDGDDFGNPVGTVYIGFSSERNTVVRKYQFSGNRKEIRDQAICAALELILRKKKKKRTGL